MRTREKAPARLRDMNQGRAVAYCANLTRSEWFGIGDDMIVELWRVFRAYILNGYRDTGLNVPTGIREIWERCKPIIDREAKR